MGATAIITKYNPMYHILPIEMPYAVAAKAYTPFIPRTKFENGSIGSASMLNGSWNGVPAANEWLLREKDSSGQWVRTDNKIAAVTNVDQTNNNAYLYFIVVGK